MRSALVLLFLLAVPCVANAQVTEPVHEKEVYSALKRFFGNMRGVYIPSSPLMWQQAVSGVGGPHSVMRLSGGNYLWFGCRYHNCDEKAAIVITPELTVKGVGLVSYHCPYRGSARQCDDKPILSIFIKGKEDHSEAEHDLEDWAKREAQVTNMEIKIVP